MKHIIFYFFIFVLFTSFMSCEKKQDTDSIILNDILQLQQAQIKSFDPLDAYHAGHIQMVKQLYNTLTDIDLDGKTIPSLAKSWETSDGLTWTFHLRDDVVFIPDTCFNHPQQRELTAKDVKYTFERLLSPNSQSLGVSYFDNFLGFKEYRNGKSDTLQGVVFLDQNTIVFELDQKNYNFPNLLTLPYTSIVKKEAVNFYGKDYKLHPVGTGPFSLASFKSNEKVVFQKNQEYWEKVDGIHLPLVDQVSIHLSTDDNLSFLMFRNQKSDFLELNLPLQKQLENSNVSFDYKKETIPWTQLNFYLFNLESIGDQNIRKGINYAISREKLSDIVSEHGVITESLFPPIFDELTTPHPILTYSQNKAKDLLDKKKSIKLICFEDILSRAMADLIAKQLKDYNITVEIESVTFPVLVDRLNSGNYDMIQLYWGPMYADVKHFLNPFLTSSFPPTGNNFNRYSNSEFDSVVVSAPGIPQDQQIDHYLKAQDIILNDMPFFLSYYANKIRVSNKKFDMPLHPLGYRFYKYANLN